MYFYRVRVLSLLQQANSASIESQNVNFRPCTSPVMDQLQMEVSNLLRQRP